MCPTTDVICPTIEALCTAKIGSWKLLPSIPPNQQRFPTREQLQMDAIPLTENGYCQSTKRLACGCPSVSAQPSRSPAAQRSRAPAGIKCLILTVYSVCTHGIASPIFNGPFSLPFCYRSLHSDTTQ